ncbi:MAG: hypothetical protein OQK24_07950 [Magnetovibrio sp.]|nr:hypothetical protein [Magnetovibrio sp.]
MMTSAVDTNNTPGTYENTQHKQSDGHRCATDLFRDCLHQFRYTGQISDIDGGDGDDLINSEASHTYIHGGAGDDSINASGWNIKVEGGSGDDVINVEGAGILFAPLVHVYGSAHFTNEGMGGHCHNHAIPLCGVLMPVVASRAYGGEGNDTINAQGLSYVRGDAGDDTISLMGGRAHGGEGDDVINHHGGSVQMFGGTGDDTLYSSGALNINSMLWGGAGNDTIEASGTHLNINGGTGDDHVLLDGTDDRGVASLFGGHNPHIQSSLTGGVGNDEFELINDAVANFEYYVGDGHDTIRGADEASVIRLGEGITSDKTSFSLSDNDLVLSFADMDGSITIKDYATSGVPSLQYNDGRMLDASTMIAYAGGDPDAVAVEASTTETAADDVQAQEAQKSKRNNKDHDEHQSSSTNLHEDSDD